VTGYGLGDQGLIPGESEDFSLHRLVHTGSVAYSDPLVTLFPEAGGGSEAKNTWNYTPLAPTFL